jgi:hypothetical protein
MSRFCWFWNLTSNNISRPQMTSDHKNFNRSISSSVSAFQKHIVWKKSKNLFWKLFSSTSSVGWNGPKNKIHPQGFCVCMFVWVIVWPSLSIPHHPSPSLIIPHHPSVLKFLSRTGLYALLIRIWIS